jgi:hypothetical protein
MKEEKTNELPSNKLTRNIHYNIRIENYIKERERERERCKT